jgi:cell division protein FtsW (lipid II flippase)
MIDDWRVASVARLAGQQLRQARPRWLELVLLVPPVLLLAIGLTTIALARGEMPGDRDQVLVGALATALFVAHTWLSIRHPRADQVILPTAAMLASLSMVMVARLEPQLATRQAVWIGIGALAMLGTLTVLPSVSWLRRYRYTWAALGLLLVLSTFIFGVDPNGSGARLWLGFGGVYFQPSEILKVLLVVFFAAYLDEYRELLTLSSLRVGPLRLPPLPYLAPLLLMLAIALGTIVLQRDLGAALLLFGLFLSMLYVASGRASYVIGGIALFVVGANVLYRLFSVVRVRVETWQDPWATATTTGYQLVQGLTALAAGGLFGTGLTFGYPEYVPAVHTDFMIAAIGEEVGLAGTLGVLALYVLLVHRGLRVAMLVRDSFSALVAAGLTAVVAIQALVILGGTLKLIPLTGVTLPLLSYGGSSILANFVLLGLLLAISGEPEKVSDAA